MNEAASASPKHVVVLVHGIRTYAHWMDALKPVLRANGFTPIATSYGRFNLLRFLFPGTFFRADAIERIRRDITTAKDRYDPDLISVIAHSFGTYVVAQIIAENPDIKFHKIVFCGSVVPEDFPLYQYADRFSAPLLNEVGTKDFWPAIAESVGWGYGSIGSNGIQDPLAENRWNNGLSHSDFLNPEFCRVRWIPFLKSTTINDIEPGDSPSEMPFFIRFIAWAQLKYAIFLAAVVALITVVILFRDGSLWINKCADELAEYAETSQTRVQSFKYHAADPGNFHINIWTRPTDDRWIEDDGAVKSYFSIEKRIHYAACDGAVVNKIAEPGLQLFISDKNCNSSILAFRRLPKCSWVGLPHMEDVK